MSIDIFGRSRSKKTPKQGPRGIGFNLTSDGNFDLRGKKLCNVATPTETSDVANKSFVISSLDSRISLEADGLSVNNRRIGNVAPPVSPNDVVCKSFLENTVPFLDETTDCFDCKSRSIANVGPPENAQDAVNLDHIAEFCLSKAAATLEDPKSKKVTQSTVFDAKNLPIDNLALPVSADSAVPWGHLENILKHLTMSLTHEMCDLAMQLRKEIYEVVPRSKKTKKTTR